MKHEPYRFIEYTINGAVKVIRADKVLCIEAVDSCTVEDEYSVIITFENGSIMDIGSYSDNACSKIIGELYDGIVKVI